MRMRTSVSLLALALAAGACSSQKKTGSISVSAAGGNATLAPAGAAIDVGGGIKVAAVHVLVKKIELEDGTCAAPMAPPGSPSPNPQPMAPGSVAPGDHGGTDDGEKDDGDDECDVEIGPIPVDLSGSDLTGKVTRVFDGQLKAGTYGEMKIKICPVSSSAFASWNGASVVVEGTVTPSGSATAKPFTLSLPVCAEIEKETKIVIDPATSSNVTLTIDPAMWFAGPNATFLDPTVDANAAAIAANVAASIGAFRDDDHDGHDDDGQGHH